MEEKTESNAKLVRFVVGVSIRGPIEPGEYKVGDATIFVSYPTEVSLGFPGPVFLPVGCSTVFDVVWSDAGGKAALLLDKPTYHQHLIIHDVLALVSQLMMSFKLVRVGHADGMKVRTVGVSDTLFYLSFVDEESAGTLNVGMTLDKRLHPWVAHGESPWDRSGTTELARPQVNAKSYPVARRFVRCFELLEHGFFKETVIVAHAILDDTIQNIVRERLVSKGLMDKKSQDSLLRAIKEDRLSVYLGPLLKVLCGKTIEEMWPAADVALKWLNTSRNRVAHAGLGDVRDDACKAIFVATKVISVLNSFGIATCKFPAGMLRTARITAAWTNQPEAWVPSGEAIELDPFDPPIVQESVA